RKIRITMSSVRAGRLLIAILNVMFALSSFETVVLVMSGACESSPIESGYVVEFESARAELPSAIAGASASASSARATTSDRKRDKAADRSTRVDRRRPHDRGSYPESMPELRTSASYRPMGDQPQAIETLAASVAGGNRYQTLLGATGTGKTATTAWVIEQIQKPTLVIAHNKTLAAQLCNEFREFFPGNAVEYFVSYYDYYQPEAYIPQADLYIEKDSSQNDDISRLRLNATSSLFTRRDVVVVASVSCIYGIGSPEEWRDRVLILEVGEEHDRDAALRKLIESQYVRNDSVLARGRFRVRGDVVEIQPANAESAYRISFFGDEVEQITHFDPVSGEVYAKLDNVAIWPATEYVTSKPTIDRAVDEIRAELNSQVRRFEDEGRMLEAHRIRQRTEYDLEMLKELNFCPGIENYSRI